MATVINNPSNEGSGAGTIIGIVVAIILIALLFIYGLPALRGSSTGTTATPGASANVDVTLPTGSGDNSGATQ
jgi:hypothetical protein